MAAEKFFPFRSVSGDRKYSAEDWAAYFALFIGNGIFYSTADRLKVVATEGMEVKVGMGAGFVNGRMYILETDKSIVLDTADGVMNRIDRVVLRCDYVNRKISTEVIKGSYSAVPTAAELTRNADVYELALADVYVGAGVVTITASAITDQRLNTELCGIVTGLVDQADTTEIFNQFQAYMQEFMTDAKEDFQEWFDAIRNTLAGDAAGNILTKIEDLEKEVADIPIIEVNNTNAVTEEGIALDARQANPTIEGTMAHDIATAQTDIKAINNNLSSLYANNACALISSFPYTAPSDGNVRLTLYKNNSTTSWNTSVYVNGNVTSYFIGTQMPYNSKTVELRVRKGDTVNYMVESGGESYIGAYGEFVAD